MYLFLICLSKHDPHTFVVWLQMTQNWPYWGATTFTFSWIIQSLVLISIRLTHKMTQMYSKSCNNFVALHSHYQNWEYQLQNGLCRALQRSLIPEQRIINMPKMSWKFCKDGISLKGSGKPCNHKVNFDILWYIFIKNYKPPVTNAVSRYRKPETTCLRFEDRAFYLLLRIENKIRR